MAFQQRSWRRAGLVAELALVVRLTDLKVRHSMGRAGTVVDLEFSIEKDLSFGDLAEASQEARRSSEWE